MTPRQLVRAFFRGASCARPPVLPIAFYHASRIDGTPPNLLTQDPTRLTRALMDQHRLLGGDCVALRFDAAVLAGLAGIRVEWSPVGPVIHWDTSSVRAWPPDALQSGPVTVLLEVIRRLAIELRKQVPILAVLPEPVGMWRRACPDSAEKLEGTVALVRHLAEEACRAGAELLVLEETAEGADPERIASATESICNTIRYYNAFSVLEVTTPPESGAADVPLFGPRTGLDDLPRGIRAGTFIPPVCFESRERLDEYTAKLRSRAHPVFLTARDDVLLSHPIEANVSLLGALRQVEWG